MFTFKKVSRLSFALNSSGKTLNDKFRNRINILDLLVACTSMYHTQL